jgi:hypothetical protein
MTTAVFLSCEGIKTTAPAQDPLIVAYRRQDVFSQAKGKWRGLVWHGRGFGNGGLPESRSALRLLLRGGDSNEDFEKRLKAIAKMRAVENVNAGIEKLQQRHQGVPLNNTADEGNSEENCPSENVGLEDIEEPRSCDEALWEAAEECDLANVEAAIERGANVNQPDPYCDNYTALHFLAVSDHAEGVELLVSRGADLGACTVHGETPLHVASTAAATAAVAKLLEVGAPRSARDKWGKTALDIALDGEHNQTIALLRGPPPPPP